MRNITVEFNYTTSDLQKFFESNPNANILQFDGSVDFGVILHNSDSSTNPKSLGWLYDFYCYCKENINIPRYTVTIICKGSSTIFKMIFTNRFVRLLNQKSFKRVVRRTPTMKKKISIILSIVPLFGIVVEVSIAKPGIGGY